MRKIAFFIFSLRKGGAEQTVLRLASFWAKEGNEVCIYILANEIEFEVPINVEIKCLFLAKPSQSPISAIGSNVGRVKRLRKILIHDQFDAFISFMPELNSVMILANLGLNRNLLICDRNNPKVNPLPKIWRYLRSALYPLNRKLVVQTEAVAACYSKDQELTVIPNPAPILAKNDVASEREALILAVGRLVPQKGFDLLINVFAKVKEEGWKLVIIGEGKDRLRLQELISKLNLKDRVQLLGKVSNPEQYYARASIFALTSQFEGFPNVLLEAMSAGLAVISNDCEYGPSEIIDHETDGLLVPFNDLSSWIDQLSKLVKEEPLRIALGDQATKKIQAKFQMKEVILQWEDLIDCKY